MKTALFYYSQTSQALRVAQSICSPLSEGEGNSVIIKQIEPTTDYPFPWNSYRFFDTFAETRLGVDVGKIKPLDFSDILDADLVVIAGQSWFLSPSLPLQAFFSDKAVQEYLNGKQVIFINACRNMWLMTSRKIKSILKDIRAILVGQIILQDKAFNLISALTVVRWLLYGKKEKGWLLPASGVREKEIKEAERFGVIIKESFERKRVSDLQNELLSNGAIKYKPSLLHIEKTGYKMFGFWAKFIRKKGGMGDPERAGRVKLFKFYLIFVLFFLSPVVQILFNISIPFRNIKEEKRKECSVN